MEIVRVFETNDEFYSIANKILLECCEYWQLRLAPSLIYDLWLQISIDILSRLIETYLSDFNIKELENIYYDEYYQVLEGQLEGESEICMEIYHLLISKDSNGITLTATEKMILEEIAVLKDTNFDFRDADTLALHMEGFIGAAVFSTLPPMVDLLELSSSIVDMLPYDTFKYYKGAWVELCDNCNAFKVNISEDEITWTL